MRTPRTLPLTTALATALLGGLALLLAGCVVLPVPTGESKVLAGTPIAEGQLAFLTPGVTTRQEVLARLGPPAVIWEEADLFVYPWQTRQGILFWAAGGASQGGMAGGLRMTDIPKRYLLFVRFDGRDRVRRFERAVCPAFTTSADCLRAWVRQDAAPPTPPAGPHTAAALRWPRTVWIDF